MNFSRGLPASTRSFLSCWSSDGQAARCCGAARAALATSDSVSEMTTRGNLRMGSPSQFEGCSERKGAFQPFKRDEPTLTAKRNAPSPGRGGAKGVDDGEAYGVQAVTATSSRNQPSPVTPQSVIDVKPMRTLRPAQPVLNPVAMLQAASRFTVVLTKVDWVPLKIAAPADPAGGQSAATVL